MDLNFNGLMIVLEFGLQNIDFTEKITKNEKKIFFIFWKTDFMEKHTRNKKTLNTFIESKLCVENGEIIRF